MAFGIPDRAGDFLPIVKYNAKAGRIYRSDRTNTGSGWEVNDVDISQIFSGVFDFENIHVGWAYFSPTGPQWVMSIYGKEPLPPQPEERGEDGKLLFKQAFKVQLALSKACGGGVRELAGTAVSIVQSIDALYQQYVASPERTKGRLPVVKLASVTPEKGSYGTNYRPVWEITSWVDRPESLQTHTNGAAADEPTVFQNSVPPATGKKTVEAPAPWSDDDDEPPPPMKKKSGVASQFKASVDADAEDFG